MAGGSAVGVVTAGALGSGTSKRLTLTAGTSNYVVPPPAAGTWQYLKVTNNHATAMVSVGINEVPAAAPATSPTPALAADWKIGYDVPPGGSELIPLVAGTLTSINVLSDTATTPVILNLIA